MTEEMESKLERKERKQYEKKIEDLMEEIEMLEKKLHTKDRLHERRLKDKDSEIEELKDENEQLLEKTKTEKSEISRLTKENKELKNELQNNTESKGDSQQILKELKQENKFLKLEINKKNDEIEMLKEEILSKNNDGGHDEEIENLKNVIENQKEEILRKANALKILRSKIDKGYVNDEKQNKEEEINKLSQKNKIIDVMKSKIDKYEAEINELKKENEKLKEDLIRELERKNFEEINSEITEIQFRENIKQENRKAESENKRFGRKNISFVEALSQELQEKEFVKQESENIDTKMFIRPRRKKLPVNTNVTLESENTKTDFPKVSEDDQAIPENFKDKIKNFEMKIKDIEVNVAKEQAKRIATEFQGTLQRKYKESYSDDNDKKNSINEYYSQLINVFNKYQEKTYVYDNDSTQIMNRFFEFYHKWIRKTIIDKLSKRKPFDELEKMGMNCLCVSINIINLVMDKIGETFMLELFDHLSVFRPYSETNAVARRMTEMILYCLCNYYNSETIKKNGRIYITSINKICLENCFRKFATVKIKLSSAIVICFLVFTNSELRRDVRMYLNELKENILSNSNDKYLGIKKELILSALDSKLKSAKDWKSCVLTKKL